MTNTKVFLKSCFILNSLFCILIEANNMEILLTDVMRETEIPTFENIALSDDFQSDILNAKAMCNSTNECSNGGLCLNDVCVCRPGTSGPFCTTIDGCNELKCGKDAVCAYDKRSFNPFCECQIFGQSFDPEDNTCKDCICDKCKEKFCIRDAVKCEFIKGEKVCTCRPHYKVNPKSQICEFCYCGDDKNVKFCDFEDDGKTMCGCEYGYQQKGPFCEKCDCPHGDCTFKNYDKVCSCYSGYSDWNGYCYQCDCGDNGKCEFDKYGMKTRCICNSGYVEISGKCEEQKICYCGENGMCELKDGKKLCTCFQGFQNVNGICTDKNECDDPESCSEYKVCTNTLGSFNCTCKEGFKPSAEEPEKCEDINECLDASSCPSSECFNTIGSFKCFCKAGYATGVASNSPVLCESQTSWKLGYGLLIGIFLAVIIALIIVLFRKR